MYKISFRKELQKIKLSKFVENSFCELCTSEGIEIEYCEPYIHEHNATVEWFNYTLMNITRLLLFQSGIPTL